MAAKSGGSTFRVPHSHGWLVIAGHCLEAQLDWRLGALVLSTGVSPHPAWDSSEQRGWVPGSGVPRELGGSAWRFDALTSEVT